MYIPTYTRVHVRHIYTIILACPNNTRIKPTKKNWLLAYEIATEARHGTHSLRKREESTTETDEAAMAADPIQGCNTKPMGRKTPGNKFGLE